MAGSHDLAGPAGCACSTTRSFVDDPTRILRGCGIDARLGLRFEPDTERLALKAIAGGAMHDHLSGPGRASSCMLLLASRAFIAPSRWARSWAWTGRSIPLWT